ncbi:glycoside hydrolase family 65 protein [Lactococcus nasutitermitis]|uniref:Glycoside hydrolase family 65 protein n=1 Tax=Lactococcus nasutitermitis TaxID=1652957 RepID=A0ABV9JEW1_9LACT|nr:glycoside hydrolase family 65 protein [Lactococcus nasutitermitis]
MQDFILTLADLGNTNTGNIETIFAQANGFLGVRASGPVLEKNATPGSFVNGFYESNEIIYGENAYGYAKNHETMVKLFDLRTIEISLIDEMFSKLVQRELFLNMKTGILNENYVYATPSGKQIKISLESFTSHANRHVYAQKWNITALNFEGNIRVIKNAKHIAPAVDSEFDPRVREASTKLVFEKNKLTTVNSNLSLYFKFDEYNDEFELNKGQTQEFVQLYQLSRENLFLDIDYDDLKVQQEHIFQEFWDVSDIEIIGDDRLQKGIRLNLYHLFNSAGRDGKTNFAAKGLTGEGYEGHYFWDTEMYLLPFFIYTQPDIAKSLLSYRVNQLSIAKERAKELDFKGALYPWRGISGHETSAYYPAGTAQLHINGDISYAFQLYEKVTGDHEFIALARDVIYETARFWISYGFHSSRGFEIHEVTGPDEYTALVNNNYYTNKMAQNNLYYAYELAKRFDENEKESIFWQQAAKQMYFGYDNKRKITQQDDSFLSKEPWDFDETPLQNYPLLLHYHPMKIYKHQVLKQADTLLAHMLFAEDIEQMARDCDFYEPLTTHDSSLSRAVHGVIASRLGRDKQAYSFFSDSAIMDLADIQGNAAHGIHAANMGGSWLGLVYGFAGLHFTSEGELAFENHLPREIQAIKFKIKYKNEIKEVFFEQKGK